MNDGVKKTFKDYPSPASDSSAEPTRWTRPMIRELGRGVQETGAGRYNSTSEGGVGDYFLVPS